MALTRLTKPFGEGLIGVDKAGIFKEGHVYGVVNLHGLIMIKDLGCNSQHKPGGALYGFDVSTLMLTGSHLLTDEELAKL